MSACLDAFGGNDLSDLDWSALEPPRAEILLGAFIDYLGLNHTPELTVEMLAGPLGDVMPAVADALARVGLAEDAQNLRAGMAALSDPSQSAEARRARLNGLSQAQRARVIEHLLRIDSARVRNLMIAVMQDGILVRSSSRCRAR